MMLHRKRALALLATLCALWYFVFGTMRLATTMNGHDSHVNTNINTRAVVELVELHPQRHHHHRHHRAGDGAEPVAMSSNHADHDVVLADGVHNRGGGNGGGGGDGGGGATVLKRTEDTVFCRHNPTLCAWLTRRRAEALAWRAYTDSRAARRSPTHRPNEVSVWWKCNDCVNVFGHVFPTLMRRVTAECDADVRCVEAQSPNVADVVVEMFDHHSPHHHHDERPGPLVARLNLEGRGYEWSRDELAVPGASGHDSARNRSAGDGGSDSTAAVVVANTDLLVSFRPESDVTVSYGYAVTDELPCLLNVPPTASSSVGRSTPNGALLSAVEAKQTACVSDYFTRMPSPAWPSNHGAIAVAIVSNCDPWRKALYLELAAVVPMDFYGTCVDRPRHVPHKASRFGGKSSTQKLKIASSYLFYVTIENTIEEGYRTEKVMQALLTNSVPVVLGDPGVDGLLPAGTFVNAHDFANMTELGAHLNALARDRERYERHLWVKKKPDVARRYLLDAARDSITDPRWVCELCKARWARRN
jgi:hypothetical protein